MYLLREYIYCKLYTMRLDITYIEGHHSRARILRGNLCVNTYTPFRKFLRARVLRADTSTLGCIMYLYTPQCRVFMYLYTPLCIDTHGSSVHIHTQHTHTHTHTHTHIGASFESNKGSRYTRASLAS